MDIPFHLVQVFSACYSATSLCDAMPLALRKTYTVALSDSILFFPISSQANDTLSHRAINRLSCVGR